MLNFRMGTVNATSLGGMPLNMSIARYADELANSTPAFTRRSVILLSCGRPRERQLFRGCEIGGYCMAMRFRKSFKLAPGLRLNIGRKGASIRVGPKGAGYTVGTSGQRVSASVPGTGFGFSSKIGKRKSDNQNTNPSMSSWVTGLVGLFLIVMFLGWLF